MKIERYPVPTRAIELLLFGAAVVLPLVPLLVGTWKLWVGQIPADYAPSMARKVAFTLGPTSLLCGGLGMIVRRARLRKVAQRNRQLQSMQGMANAWEQEKP